MKIKIDKVHDSYYRADFIELGGSPFIGDGKTAEMAVACLFLRNLKNLERLDCSTLEINDVKYEYPYSIDR